jgi:hypothetical protein
MKPRHLRHAVAMFVLASVGGGCFGCYAWLAHGIAHRSVRERAVENTGAAPPPLITVPSSSSSSSPSSPPSSPSSPSTR